MSAKLAISIPVLILFAAALVALIWAFAKALQSAHGRRVLATGGVLLVLFVLLAGSWILFRFRQASHSPTSSITSTIRVEDDFEGWQKVAAIQSGDSARAVVLEAPPAPPPASTPAPLAGTKPWVATKGGSRFMEIHSPRFNGKLWLPGPGGELVGYSNLQSTREDAMAMSMKLLSDKIEAFVLKTIAEKAQDVEAREIDIRNSVKAEVLKFLEGRSAKVDQFEESVHLPESGATAYRAASMVKVSDGWISDAMRSVSENLKKLQEAARSNRRTWAWTVFSASILAIAIFLLYSFLNAGTKGHLAWPLRLVSFSAFLILCFALLVLRGHVP